MNESAKVISLTERIAANDAVTDHSGSPPTGSTSFGYLGNSQQRDRTVSRRLQPPSRLDHAFAAICATLDDAIGEIERSNSFDEWKEALDQEASINVDRSAASRQILGILLAATRQKDISDFGPAALRAFRATTNTLRRPNAVLLDVKTVIKYLNTARVVAFLPLESRDISVAREAELDRFLNDLVTKHS